MLGKVLMWGSLAAAVRAPTRTRARPPTSVTTDGHHGSMLCFAHTTCPTWKTPSIAAVKTKRELQVVVTRPYSGGCCA